MDLISVYSNIYFVQKTRKNLLIPDNIRRSGAWILWSIWKNRNAFFFEGKLALGPSFINGIYKEVDHWFFIKSLEEQEKTIDLEKKKRIIFGWKPPPISWFKCDIGIAWDKVRNQSGASWLLRNREGKVLLHGRRSFAGIFCKLDAFMESWLWAIECLKTLHFNQIIFASEDHDMINTINKPSAWPSLRFYSYQILPKLNEFADWKAQYHSHHHIKGAKLIAVSIIKEDFYQSYIAKGHPCWLNHLFS